MTHGAQILTAFLDGKPIWYKPKDSTQWLPLDYKTTRHYFDFANIDYKLEEQGSVVESGLLR